MTQGKQQVIMPPPPSQTTESQLFFFLLLLSLCVLVLLRVMSGEVPDQGEAAALFRRWRQEGRSLRPRERGTCLCTCTNQETAFVQRAHAFERKEGLEQSLTREECCAQRSYACGGENHPREVAAPLLVDPGTRVCECCTGKAQTQTRAYYPDLMGRD